MFGDRYIHGPNVHIHEITDDSVCIQGECTQGNYHEFVVDKQNVVDYHNGSLIQNAFPTLDTSQREFLMTGMCCHPIWNQ